MGPLAGVRVLELDGIGPGPFAGMMLSDLGAEVVRVERPVPAPSVTLESREGGPLLRGRRRLGLDLKDPRGLELALRLAERADVLIDPFRPGVLERLGAGPEVLLARNPRLVLVRVTGWGQEGPLARAAGHDIDYVALSGALAAIGRAGSPPAAPLNLLADFGGGGMLAALGAVAALYERERSGLGQVVDAAMVDGVAALFAGIAGLMASGLWSGERESNLLDGGAPFYDTYETSDGRFVAVGALEPQFYALLLERLGLDREAWPQHDRSRWPALRAELVRIFGSRTQAEWCAELEGTDACFAPVLALAEAAAHPQLVARETYVERDGVLQPAPAPRFSRTPGALRERGPDGPAVLADWGVEEP